MPWKYRGAVNENGVNFHVWSAVEEGGLVFAVTRTSVIEPQNPVVYRSIEEIAERNGFRLGHATEEEAPMALPPPPRPDRPFGIFRRPGGWVEVSREGVTMPMPADLYRREGIWPEYDRLPSEAQYRASQRAPAPPERKIAAE
jgi:hypothetical protein